MPVSLRLTAECASCASQHIRVTESKHHDINFFIASFPLVNVYLFNYKVPASVVGR